MELKQIEGKRVRLSARTITVLNDAGKTAGLVRGLKRFLDLPPRESFGLHKQLSASGLWGNSDAMKAVFVDGKQLVFFYNLAKDDFYHQYMEGHNLQHEDEAFERRKRTAEAAKAAGVLVIPCRY